MLSRFPIGWITVTILAFALGAITVAALVSSGPSVAIQIEPLEVAEIDIDGKPIRGAKVTLRNDGLLPVWYIGRSGKVTSYSTMPARQPIPEFEPYISEHDDMWSRLDPGDTVSFTDAFDNVDLPIRIGTCLCNIRSEVTMHWTRPIGNDLPQGG